MFWFLGTSLSAERAGSTLQQKKKGTVAIQSAFTGKSAYSRKNTSADSSACASLTCESRAYSVLSLAERLSAAGNGCLFNRLSLHSVPPAKVLLLFSRCRQPMGLRGITVLEVCFLTYYIHVSDSLNILPLHFILQKHQDKVCSFNSKNKR